MKDSNSLGSFGETRAALYLKSKGYNIIQMNFRCRSGEIDIIAADREYIVFAEVKLRKDDQYGSAAAFVDKRKQRKIMTAARYYLAYKDPGLQPRFDVIEVYAPFGERGAVEIYHIEDAFSYGSLYNS